MPTYEYACHDCGEHLEVVQSFHDDNLEVCPACDGRLRRVFSPAGIIFKGSGWHSTDYGRSSATSATGDGQADGQADTSPDTQDDAQPDTAAGEDTPAEKSA